MSQLFLSHSSENNAEAVASHVTFSKEGLARLRRGLAKAGLDPRFFAWPPENFPNRPPYRGLKPLEAADAGIFFGRDGPIVEALDTLRGLREAASPRLLVILGASGAGKSSFLRAGLWPRLVRDDRNFLPLPVVRPERAAISGETGLLHAIPLAASGVQSRRQLIARWRLPTATTAFLKTATRGSRFSVGASYPGLPVSIPRHAVRDDGSPDLVIYRRKLRRSSNSWSSNGC
jgi:hypothetical protein